MASYATPRPRIAQREPSLSGTTTVGQTLTCNPGLWTGRRLTITYQWLRNAATVIGGATSATYLLAAPDGNATVKCAVTATANDSNYGAQTVTTPATVAITP